MILTRFDFLQTFKSLAGGVVLTAITILGSSNMVSAQTPFSCSDNAYIMYGPNAGVSLYNFDLVTGSVGSVIYNTGNLANCLAYNPLDNLLYMLVTQLPLTTASRGELVVVGADGTHLTLAVPHLGDATGLNPTVGGITTDGYYVVNTTSGTSNRYVTIDLDASRSTYLQIVDPTSGYTVAAAPYYKTASVNLSVADWAYNPTDGLFYGLTSTSGSIATLDIETGSYSVGSSITLYDGTAPVPATYGAAYIDATGKLYVTSNNGVSYSIDIATAKAIRLSTGTLNTNFDGANCPDATLVYGISGNVFNDVNGLTDNTVNGVGTNAGGVIYATLYDNTTGMVVASVPVAANGAYAFGATPNNDYSIYIGNVAATVGQTAFPSTTLPDGYINTGEQNCGNTVGCTGNDGAHNGVIELGVVSGEISQANFGIQELPETVVNIADTVVTPPAGTPIPVTPVLFTDAIDIADPSSEDYSGGTVDSMRITTFPIGADSVTINGVTYTPATFPINGVTVDYTPSVGVSGVEVYPSDDADEIVIHIAAIDNAGAEDPTPGSITIPLNTIRVSGSVFNDANGGNVNPTELTNIIPAGLYANLIDDAGNVVATVPVNTDGTYDFTRVQPGDYTVQLSTNDDAINVSEIEYSLQTGWVNTGACNCEPDMGNTGILTGTSAVFTVTNVDVDNINFGIERTSTADEKDYNLPFQPDVDDEIALNGLGGAPLMSGSDPEDGIYTGNTGTQNNPNGVVITSLPTNGELWYNGVLVTIDDIADGTVFDDPSLFTVKLTGAGYFNTTFEYAYVDVAGVIGSSNTYTLTWGDALPIKLIRFDAIAKDNTSLLKWGTVSEKFNKGFEVERSGDGRTWKTIGFVATLADDGNSSSPLDYTYTDNAPFKGTNFYRLKQVDINGKYEYSEVRTVNFTAQSSIVLSPNPTNDVVAISGLSRGNNHIVVNNAIGQQIINTNIDNQSSYSVDLARFAAGTYYISIRNEDGTVSNHKLVKQ